MERSGTAADRRRNPRFAILGLSHIAGRCTGVSEWSSSLSISCFGGGSNPLSVDHHDDAKTDAAPPTRRDVVVRKISAKASRRQLSTRPDHCRQSRPTHQQSSTHSTSLQVSRRQLSTRPDHCHQSRQPSSTDSTSLQVHFSIGPTVTVVKVIRRLHDEAGSTSWLDELAIWSFEWCNIANIHEAARRALVERSSCARRALDELARRALDEPARQASSSSQLHRVKGV